MKKIKLGRHLVVCATKYLVVAEGKIKGGEEVCVTLFITGFNL